MAIDLQEVTLQFRTQLSLSPDLTIDAYLEPFASIGTVDSFGELAAPRSRDLRPYQIVDRGEMVTVSDGSETFTIPDPDFAFVSLRSTVVVRWEYLPGRVIYAVWRAPPRPRRRPRRQLHRRRRACGRAQVVVLVVAVAHSPSSQPSS